MFDVLKISQSLTFDQTQQNITFLHFTTGFQIIQIYSNN